MRWQTITILCRRIVPALVISIGLCFGFRLSLGVTTLVVSAAEPPDGQRGVLSSQQEITRAVRHDIIILLDNSGSLVRPYRVGSADGVRTISPVTPDDGNQRRIRFSRFLVRALQSLAPETTSVGVALFGAEVTSPAPQTSTIPIAPLMPVAQWTAADIAAIQQRNCPEADARGPDGGYLAYEKGKDLCFGTRYQPALQWAAEQLGPCESDDRTCDVIIFTDGELDEKGNSDDRSTIIRALQRMRDQGIDVNLVLLAGQGQQPSRLNDWNKWQANGYVSQVSHVSADMPTSRLIDAGLKQLPFNDLLRDFTLVEVTPEGNPITLAVGLPPNVVQFGLDLVADSPITEVYTLEPSQRSDIHRSWAVPETDSLAVTLEGNGLAYYRVFSKSAPIQLALTTLPTLAVLGEPVQVQAFLRVGSKVLSDSQKVNVTADVYGVDSGTELISIPLTVQDSGMWFGTLEQIWTAGDYEISATVKSRNPPLESLPLDMRESRVTFGAGELPQARLNIRPQRQYATLPVEFEINLSPRSDYSTGLPGDVVTVTILEGKTPLTTQVVPAAPVLSLQQPMTPSGTYNVHAEIVGKGWEISTNERQLDIVDLPSLSMEASQLEALPGDSIQIVITVEGKSLDSSTLPTPILDLRNGELIGSLSPHEDRWIAEVAMLDSGDLIAEATLPLTTPDGGKVNIRDTIEVKRHPGFNVLGRFVSRGHVLLAFVVILALAAVAALVVIVVRRNLKRSEDDRTGLVSELRQIELDRSNLVTIKQKLEDELKDNEQAHQQELAHLHIKHQDEQDELRSKLEKTIHELSAKDAEKHRVEKRLYNGLMTGNREFWQELAVLPAVEHLDLVRDLAAKITNAFYYEFNNKQWGNCPKKEAAKSEAFWSSFKREWLSSRHQMMLAILIYGLIHTHNPVTKKKMSKRYGSHYQVPPIIALIYDKEYNARIFRDHQTLSYVVKTYSDEYWKAHPGNAMWPELQLWQFLAHLNRLLHVESTTVSDQELQDTLHETLYKASAETGGGSSVFSALLLDRDSIGLTAENEMAKCQIGIVARLYGEAHWVLCLIKGEPSSLCGSLLESSPEMPGDAQDRLNQHVESVKSNLASFMVGIEKEHQRHDNVLVDVIAHSYVVLDLLRRTAIARLDLDDPPDTSSSPQIEDQRLKLGVRHDEHAFLEGKLVAKLKSWTQMSKGEIS